MLDWGFLIDESVLASVLSDESARFRRPLSGALAVFLEGLPAARQAASQSEAWPAKPPGPMGASMGSRVSRPQDRRKASSASD